MTTEKKRILVVDDEPPNTQLLKLYLERTNDYVVREENDPRAAISSAEEFQPDLILLDLKMPGMSGGTLAASFETNDALKAIPIVFLTAAITKEEVKASFGRIGKFPFLAKPIVLTEVLACIRQHLSG